MNTFQKESIQRDTFEKVCLLYDLGEIVSDPTPELGGLISNIYKVITDKGIYMFRIHKKLSSFQLNQLDLEYAATEYLSKNNFFYDVPIFLKNNKGKIRSKVDGEIFEVYLSVLGDVGNHEMKKSPKEMIEVVARYHRAIKNFPADRWLKKTYKKFPSGLNDKIELIKKIKSPLNSVDKIMTKNIGLFIEVNNILKKNSDLSSKKILLHDDIHPGNLILNNGKITGIIDFGKVRWGPKERDLARVIGHSLTEIKEGVKHYKKFNNISYKEIPNIFLESLNYRLESIFRLYEDLPMCFEKKVYFLNSRIKKMEEVLTHYKEFRK